MKCQYEREKLLADGPEIFILYEWVAKIDLTEPWSLLAYVRRNVTEMRLKGIARWHQTETQDREINRRGYYIPRTKEGISLILGNASKNHASRYYQLKVGHSWLK